jgi:hypothetical protein
MPKPARYLVQLRLTDSDRRRIKSLAAKQGLTLQDAVVEAFDAWAEKLRTGGSSQAKRQAPRSTARAFEPAPQAPSLVWLARALKADWTQCPEAEFASDGTNGMWLLRGSDAPINEVMSAIDDGIPVPEIAKIFSIELALLARVIEFAATAQEADAIN